MIDRSSGRSLFGQSPSLYESGRPGYPERVYELLVDRCGLGPASRVFEVGPGTGQATVRLAEAGASVTAIEPDSALAAWLTEKVQGFPNVSVHVASFEEGSLPAASFDLGIAATSFHWIDPAAGLSKVRALLAPGGWWAMWWTVFQDAGCPDPFYEATDPILAPLDRSPAAGVPGGPPFALDLDRRRAELKAAGMANIEAEVIPWAVHLDAKEVRSLYATFSLIARLPPKEREDVLDAVEAVAEDSFGGQVERPFQTVVYTSRRT
ncbi:MAG: class I SAM-dependent methyltransferase [Solirubrobacterales bacterium]